MCWLILLGNFCWWSIVILFQLSTDSAVLSSSGSTPSSEYDYLITAITAIRFSFLPIVLMGTVTNILNMIVFCHSKVRNSSTSMFFSVLAFADLCYIYLDMFRIWIEWMDDIIDPLTYISHAYCKCVNYLAISSRDISNWMIVCITMERVIAIAGPLRAKRLCSVANTRILIVSVIIMVMLAHSHYVIYSKAVYCGGYFNKWQCWYNSENTKAALITSWWKSAFSGISVVTVISLNISLVILLVKKKRNRVHSNTNNFKDQTYRLTRLVLGISVLFFICELPLSFMDIGLKTNPKPEPYFYIILHVTLVLAGINHSSNFFLYVWSGTLFRSHLVNILRCRGIEDTRGNTESQIQSIYSTDQRRLSSVSWTNTNNI